jgi:hypothetical protein
MEYYATFKSNLGLVVLVIPVCGLLIAVSAAHSEIKMVILGAVPLIWLLAIRIRLKVTISDGYLEYRGLLASKRIRLLDVTDCRSMESLGYPYDRLYGPYTYRIKTPAESLKINFKFFPLECMNSVLANLPEEYV